MTRVLVLWRPKYLFPSPLLNENALSHDGHVVAQGIHDGQVMADEQAGKAERSLQLAEQVQDLGLHGDVKCTRGLVRDE